MDLRKRWRGEVSYAALAEAKEILDVKGPVNIKRSTGNRRRGSYRFKSGRHDIRVSTYCNLEQANTTIFHELAHAAQQERSGDWDSFVMEYRAQIASKGYEENGFEREAEAAKDFANEIQIAI